MNPIVPTASARTATRASARTAARTATRIPARTAVRLAAAGLSLTLGLGAVGPATAAAPSGPSAYRVTGVDTSHHNHADGKGGETARIDWRKVAASQSFAFLKATQNTRTKDGWFARDWRRVSATSLARAPYHFFDPRGASDGLAQAEHFLRTVRAAGYTGKRAGELPPVLDVEKVPGPKRKGGKREEVCPRNLRSGQLGAFLRRVEKEFGVKPIVYTRASFVKDCMRNDGRVFAGYPLWLARYAGNATTTPKEPAAVPGAGAKWTFWQHTEHGKVAGVRTAVDKDVFSGTAARLRKMAHH